MVRTNDPRRPEIRLTLSGNVEKFASVEPGFVYFRGEAGEVKPIELEITPNSITGFRIVEVVTDKSGQFTAELIKPCDEKNTSCRIRVTNMVENQGRYIGVIHVKTDSKIQSSFPIVVRAKIL